MTDAVDFFRGRLDQMIELRHPLAILASRMPWQELEASVAGVLDNRVRAGKKTEGPLVAEDDRKERPRPFFVPCISFAL